MDQETGEWKEFLTRANQLFRATMHPARVQLPVEGRMPSLDNATGWLNRIWSAFDNHYWPALYFVDTQGHGTVTEPRLYQLVRQPGPISERTVEVTFLDPGVQAYAFIFG